MKYKHLFHTLWIALAVAIAGCTAPGVQFQQGNKIIALHEGESAMPDLDRLVDVYPITPSLLLDLEQQQQSLVQQAVATGRKSIQTTTASPYEYKIGTGDVLHVVVWGYPEFSSDNTAVSLANLAGSSIHQTIGNIGAVQKPMGVVVDAQGNIFFPYAGRIRAAGLTAEQLRAQLMQRLSRYLRHPQVNVSVAAFQSQHVNVGGAVKNPGMLTLASVPLRVLDAVHMAGGLASNADATRVRLVRSGTEHTLSLYDMMQRGDMRHNMLLRAGDILFVPSNAQMKVHVMGEVGKQVTLTIPEGGMSLTDALSGAGGLSQAIADASGVFVVRGNLVSKPSEKIARVYQLNLRDASAFALGNRFRLQPDDVVFVTAAPIGQWNRVLGQVFPSISALGSLAATYGVVTR